MFTVLVYVLSSVLFCFFPKLKRIFSQVHHKMLVNALCGDKTKKETETKTIFSISRLSSVWKKSSDVPALSESWAVTSLLKHSLFQRFLQPCHVQPLSSLVAHQCTPSLTLPFWRHSLWNAIIYLCSYAYYVLFTRIQAQGGTGLCIPVPWYIPGT